MINRPRRVAKRTPVPAKLIAECERLGLEGIVSKLGNQPYRSGSCDWSKTKTKAWLEANRDRRELFK